MHNKPILSSQNLTSLLLCVWNSELTGDLMYFVKGIKSFAELLIDHGDDAIVIKEGIRGLINSANETCTLMSTQNEEGKEGSQAFSRSTDDVSTVKIVSLDSSVSSAEAYQIFNHSINLATLKVTCRDATDSSAQAYAGSGDHDIIPYKKKGCPKAQNPVLLPKVSNKFSKAGTTQCGEARPQKKTPFVPCSAHTSVEAIEVKKGEMETQWKFDEEVLQEERRKVQATKLTMDATQDEADAQNLVLPKVSNIYSKAGTIQCCEARPAEVDDVRTRMNEEVANLKSVLKSVKGKMDEKEREVHRAMEGRGDTEKLMEEIRYVMIIQSRLLLLSSSRRIRFMSHGRTFHVHIIPMH